MTRRSEEKEREEKMEAKGNCQEEERPCALLGRVMLWPGSQQPWAVVLIISILADVIDCSSPPLSCLMTGRWPLRLITTSSVLLCPGKGLPSAHRGHSPTCILGGSPRPPAADRGWRRGRDGPLGAIYSPGRTR